MPFARLSVFFFAAIAVLAPASAQSVGQLTALSDRIVRLERDLRDVQAELYGHSSSRTARSGEVVGVAASMSAAQAGDLSVRITQIERELQTLTGEIERANYLIQQNAQAIEALQAVVSGGAAPQQSAQGPSSGPTQLRGASERVAPAPVIVTLPDDPDRAYAYAYDFLVAEDYGRATSAFEQFVERFPSHPKAPDAKYRLGEIYLVTDQFASAADVFLDFIRKHSDHPRAPESYLKLGQAFARLEKTSEACQVLGALPRQYPDALPVVLERASRERDKLGC
ncbi:MAG: tol-pal system protein YbgF [Pseudomonadota bacterium]